MPRYPWVHVGRLFPFPKQPPKMGCTFKEKSRDAVLALVLLYLENYIKCPGVGVGVQRGFPCRGENNTLCPPLVGGKCREAGLGGVAPSIERVRGFPWPPS